MARLGISEILDKASSKKEEAEKIDVLRQYASVALTGLVHMNYDKLLEWDLDEGIPEFEKCTYDYNHNSLYRWYKKLYLFWKPGEPYHGNPMPRKRKAKTFLNFLETTSPDDALVVAYIKDKKLEELYQGLDIYIFNKAYPKLFPEMSDGLEHIEDDIVVEDIKPASNASILSDIGNMNPPEEAPKKKGNPLSPEKMEEFNEENRKKELQALNNVDNELKTAKKPKRTYTRRKATKN